MESTNCLKCSQKFNITSEAPKDIENVLHILKNSVAFSAKEPPTEALLRFVKQESDPLNFEMCADCCQLLQKAVGVHMNLADVELKEYETVLANSIDSEILIKTDQMKKQTRIHDSEIAMLEEQLQCLTSREADLEEKNKKLSAKCDFMEMENMALRREYNRCKRELTGSYISKAR